MLKDGLTDRRDYARTASVLYASGAYWRWRHKKTGITDVGWRISNLTNENMLSVPLHPRLRQWNCLLKE